METMNTLNTIDGWEDIVNGNAVMRSSARERVAARKRERRIKKMQMAICVLAGTCILSVILGVAGAMASWLTTMVAVGCLVSASILFGQFVEVNKR